MAVRECEGIASGSSSVALTGEWIAGDVQEGFSRPPSDDHTGIQDVCVPIGPDDINNCARRQLASEELGIAEGGLRRSSRPIGLEDAPVPRPALPGCGERPTKPTNGWAREQPEENNGDVEQGSVPEEWKNTVVTDQSKPVETSPQRMKRKRRRTTKTGLQSLYFPAAVDYPEHPEHPDIAMPSSLQSLQDINQVVLAVEEEDRISTVSAVKDKDNTADSNSTSGSVDSLVSIPTRASPKKPQRSKLKTGVSSSYFSSPSASSSSSPVSLRRHIPKPKPATFSPHFTITAYDVDINKSTRGRPTPSFLSSPTSLTSLSPFPSPLPTSRPAPSIPWPPLTAPRFGLVQESLSTQPFQLLVSTVFLNRTRGSVAIPLLRQFLAKYSTPEEVAGESEEVLEGMIQPLGLQRTRARRLCAMAKAWVETPPRRGVGMRKKGYPLKNVPAFPVVAARARALHEARNAGNDTDPAIDTDNSIKTEQRKEKDEEQHDQDEDDVWEISHIPGVGPYALDSWRIFCRDALRGDVEAGEEEWRRVVPADKELRAFLRWRWAREGVRWVEEGDCIENGMEDQN